MRSAAELRRDTTPARPLPPRTQPQHIVGGHCPPPLPPHGGRFDLSRASATLCRVSTPCPPPCPPCPGGHPPQNRAPRRSYESHKLLGRGSSQPRRPRRGPPRGRGGCECETRRCVSQPGSPHRSDVKEQAHAQGRAQPRPPLQATRMVNVRIPAGGRQAPHRLYNEPCLPARSKRVRPPARRLPHHRGHTRPRRRTDKPIDRFCPICPLGAKGWVEYDRDP